MMVGKSVSRVLWLLVFATLVCVRGSSLAGSPDRANDPHASVAFLPGQGRESDARFVEDADAKHAAMIPKERLRAHVPDPELYRPVIKEAMRKAIEADDKALIRRIERVMRRIDEIRRPRQVRLSLEDTLHRAMVHSYFITTQSYNPAIETTRVVEAQAEFDAAFFTNINNQKIDRPTGSQLTATSIDSFVSNYGFRKTLSSGAQVSATWNLNRVKTALAFQQINPEYRSTLDLALRQPLMRAFGIDFNRSLIVIAKNTRSISDWAFRRDVRDTLRQVEELYWRLVQARRDVAITARLLADFEGIYSYLEARRAFDVIPVQLNDTRANLEQAKADFIRRKATVFDAEQRLLAAINDPDLPVGGGAEIIPIGLPQYPPMMVDPLAEVQVALENRPEIREQELNIANAKIAVGRAENLELPRLDATFQYTVDGLSTNADRAFDQMTGSNFLTYFVGVEFELPVGNRAARASTYRARLQESQAEAALRSLFEEIILDVHITAREMHTSWDQIGPSYQSAEARERQVDSLVARAERKDFNTLTNELNARQSLAADRRAMLNAMVNYRLAIIDLERAKGTLLRYNNVIIPKEAEKESH